MNFKSIFLLCMGVLFLLIEVYYIYIRIVSLKQSAQQYNFSTWQYITTYFTTALEIMYIIIGMGVCYLYVYQYLKI